MKKTILLASALLFMGCGSSDSSIEGSESKIVNMEYNKIYSVKKGDKIVKTTDDAIVKITKQTESETSDVELLEGKAQIISAL